MRGERRGEHGQATVEWTGLLLVIALALIALSHLAPKADGRELGATLADAATGAQGVEEKSRAEREIFSAHPAPTPLTAAVRRKRSALPNLPRLPRSMTRARRGIGAVWRKAWFACLVYERTRYALRHPESRIPGYTLPYGTALRMINNCVSPVDLLRDLSASERGR